MASHGKGICAGTMNGREEEGGLRLALVERVGASMPRSCATARQSYEHGELS